MYDHSKHWAIETGGRVDHPPAHPMLGDTRMRQLQVTVAEPGGTTDVQLTVYVAWTPALRDDAFGALKAAAIGMEKGAKPGDILIELDDGQVDVIGA